MGRKTLRRPLVYLTLLAAIIVWLLSTRIINWFGFSSPHNRSQHNGVPHPPSEAIYYSAAIDDIYSTDPIYGDSLPPGNASGTYSRHSTSGWVGPSLDREGIPIPAQEWDLPDLVKRKYDLQRGNMIVLVVVDWSLRDMVLNWLCHVRSLNIHNYILIAPDTQIKNYLLSIGESVVYHPALATSTSTPEYDSPQFIAMMHARLKLILSVLQMNMTVVSADVDSVWLDNPLPWIWDSLRQASDEKEVFPSNVQRCGPDKGPKVACDIIAQSDMENRAQFCFGLVAFKPTLDVWEMLSNVSTIMSNEHINHTGKQHNDQEVLGQLLTESTKVNWNVLNTHRFPPGRSFFVSTVKDYLSGSRIPPIVVHNNWILGHKPKIARFEKYGLWRVGNADEGLCLDSGLPSKPPPLVVNKVVTAVEPPAQKLRIIILCNGNLPGLVSAIESLAKTHWGTPTPSVDLDLVMNPTLNKSTIKSYVSKIKKIRWKSGDFQYRVGLNSHVLAQQWANLWNGSSDAVLVADETLRVSSSWYAWSVSALTAKCGDGGREVDRRIASVIPVVTSSIGYTHMKPLRIQERSTWNRVFLKHHWKQFYRWLNTLPESFVPGFPFATYPIVGQIHGSIWDRTWSLYHSTFMGEKGYWTLSSRPSYSTTHDEDANTDEIFAEQQLWNTVETDLATCHQMPVVDYWASTVSTSNALAHRVYLVWGMYPKDRQRMDVPQWLERSVLLSQSKESDKPVVKWSKAEP
ncbi:hypothetical protein SmJEL517_g03978 [Synchytrium microbalum]|uniref:Nucleotide-diphospho-sugar transferase domain-containing protein n=1 Tax=Synchytrium microbalum TaxID=1806994 RepID=A0A507C662_9FUNG|nr:uncharacterized protein SmJEL517_g03978 [Synchytrium microbalum]TPX33033.1 hypothetical protein SmJEL517_g03978 [Synchytrium microbalum]